MGGQAGRKSRDSERFRQAFIKLGERIQARRREHGWSQDELAEHCGMSGTAISEIERAAAFVTVESLFLIAAALGVQASTLLMELDPLVREPSELADLPF